MKPVARATRKKVKGLLKVLLEMPIDVINEVFLQCDLETLVRVSRISKKFYCQLETASSHVWREVFARDKDIPEAPEGWSLMKWAGLLFGERCCQVSGRRNLCGQGLT